LGGGEVCDFVTQRGKEFVGCKEKAEAAAEKSMSPAALLNLFTTTKLYIYINIFDDIYIE
jgi:hypothetical protein